MTLHVLIDARLSPPGIETFLYN